MMNKIIKVFKSDIVLTVSWFLAISSALIIKPDRLYIGYIDWRSLGIL